MSTHSMPVESVEYYRVKVTAEIAGSAYDPTGDVVSFQFVPLAGERSSASPVEGSWETVNGAHYAMCLVGEDVSLEAGTYSVFLTISDDPETPVDEVGTLKLY